MTKEQALAIISGDKSSTAFIICPWQEIRISPYLHYQIDLILTPEQVYSLDTNSAYMDLQRMYMGLEAGYILKHSYKDIKYHIAVNPQPLIKYWKYVITLPGKLDNKFLQEDNTYLFSGWRAKILDKGYDILAGTKELKDGKIQVSYAMFVERK